MEMGSEVVHGNDNVGVFEVGMDDGGRVLAVVRSILVLCVNDGIAFFIR